MASMVSMGNMGSMGSKGSMGNLGNLGSMKTLVLLLALLALTSCWEMEVVPCNIEHCNDCDITNTNCTSCDPSFYLNDEGGQCSECNATIAACDQCGVDEAGSLTCDVCALNLLPTDSATECLSCSTQLPNCQACLIRTAKLEPLKCEVCEQPYELEEGKCKEKSNAGTIIIVTAIVGGIVLIGLGFAIFKCMRKKKGVSRLLEDDYQE